MADISRFGPKVINDVVIEAQFLISNSSNDLWSTSISVSAGVTPHNTFPGDLTLGQSVFHTLGLKFQDDGTIWPLNMPKYPTLTPIQNVNKEKSSFTASYPIKWHYTTSDVGREYGNIYASKFPALFDKSLRRVDKLTISHSIDAGNLLPIKLPPRWYSPAQQQAIREFFKRDWAAGISLLDDTDEDIKDFMKNRIETYKLDEHQGDDLWWDFYNDFHQFTTVEDFLRAGIELPRRLDEPPIWPTSDKDFERVSKMLSFDPSFQKYITTPGEKDKKYLNTNFKNNKARYRSDDDRFSIRGNTQPQNVPYIIKLFERGIDIQSNNYDEERILEYNPHGYSRELATLNKLYDNENKYSGNGDAIDYKFDIFLRNCENADSNSYYKIQLSNSTILSLLTLCTSMIMETSRFFI
ncbi:hypothetical protein EV44_g3278 [Erysiphe necator]|uniref:Uncharacterized protein n=1 Tax=Uncinula necator TaxID=52586 RepID=A0A0B1P759_UNCNE|nr:hypothetical protein EV44_g3278 [Erysiphe necator]